MGFALEQVADPAQFNNIVAGICIQFCRHFQEFNDPVVVAQFKMLGEVGYLWVPGNQLLSRVFQFLSIQPNLT